MLYMPTSTIIIDQSFEYRHKSNLTELSKAVWRAKDAGEDPIIRWSITAHYASY